LDVLLKKRRLAKTGEIENFIDRGLGVETMDTDVEYEIDVEIKAVEEAVVEARERYENGERVDVKDLSRLVDAGVIPADDIPLRRPYDDEGDGS
jgi:hypothetical protein